MTFSERLLRLEQKSCPPYTVPGTTLSRCFLPISGVGWSLGLGMLMEPKQFFVGNTIEDCLDQAEKVYL